MSIQNQNQNQNQNHTREISYGEHSHLSMSRNVRYTTQQGIWDCQILDTLTDADIRRYAKQGRYGEEYKQKMLARQAEKRNKGKSSKRKAQDLIKLLLS